MTIHLILGRQGSGKTLLMVKLAYDYMQRTENKGTVYANFHLNFPYNKIHYDDIINCRLTDCMTLLDEVHLLLPARRSMSSSSVKICMNFLSMARKQNNEIYGTTQVDRKVDVLFRDEADYIYFCTKYAWIDNQWIEVLHDSVMQDNDMVIIMVEILDKISGNITKMAFHGNKYYPLYDTKEIVEIEGMPDD